ncbi:MAG: Arc family DNA-binding protein [Clostridiales bacterium]|jgi:hypothetical protein|nr:Arc family DNA-binding protein [Clostridiales bacterium]
MNKKEDEKKQILLRLSKSVWDDINKWAADELRSVNGQIEYILRREINRRKGDNGAE